MKYLLALLLLACSPKPKPGQLVVFFWDDNPAKPDFAVVYDSTVNFEVLRCKYKSMGMNMEMYNKVEK